MQEFPSEVLMMVLQETSEKQPDRITDFPETLNSGPGFEKGAPNVQTRLDTISVLKKSKAKQTCLDT